MRVTVSEAKGQLTELVRRAEAGEEVIITRTSGRECHGFSTNSVSQSSLSPG
jgi:hypothetical protein